MENPILQQLDRQQRRMLLSTEKTMRDAGVWGEWETVHFPRGSVGDSWAAEFQTAHRNKVFCVLDRTLSPSGVRHLAVTSLSGIRPTWHEMQRIKNEIAGHGATAVELYPPQAEVVDEADMYHIWVTVLPMPFSLSPVRWNPNV
ncbi:hypothetical protein [Bradyrhizobium sp. Ai1a-2]|uniref:DUF7694 domain-containing protein n=1 Tax=Bradyrhizobium sp. Ai1a-2 TaxID=196490 RepID=UPI0003FFE98D|nr:hypothetical protein [Bradyrhizobium sp. Ai1a-2]